MQPSPDTTLTIDPATVIQFVHTHQWAPIIALVVGLFVRFVKDDAGKLPAVWRAPFGLLVSMVIPATAAIYGGMAWQVVVENGLIAFVLAILGHETIIEGARSGVEIPIPWLTKRAANANALPAPAVPALHEVPPPPPAAPPPPTDKAA